MFRSRWLGFAFGFDLASEGDHALLEVSAAERWESAAATMNCGTVEFTSQ
ncbi:hypothetical protein ACVILK_002485 [Bradyrhizobium embrapense]